MYNDLRTEVPRRATLGAHGERKNHGDDAGCAASRSSAQTLLACAELEEANARVLEGILEAET